MTIQELLKEQANFMEYQLNAVFKDIPEEKGDVTVAGQFSPRQTLQHLCECYVAYLAYTEGKEHEWGTYQPADTSLDALRAEMKRLRDQMHEKAYSSNNDDFVLKALDFGVVHDSYHVGQMVTWRLNVTPDFSPYSIYPGH